MIITVMGRLITDEFFIRETVILENIIDDRKQLARYGAFKRLLGCFTWVISSAPGCITGVAGIESERYLFIAVVASLFSRKFPTKHNVRDMHPLIYDELSTLFHRNTEWLDQEFIKVEALISHSSVFKKKLERTVRECEKDKKFWLQNLNRTKGQTSSA